MIRLYIVKIFFDNYYWDLDKIFKYIDKNRYLVSSYKFENNFHKFSMDEIYSHMVPLKGVQYLIECRNN